MIVPPSQLVSLSGQVAMADGCFDPLHAGHVDYLRAAAGLGLPVLCNVAGDRYLASKHPPLLPAEERVELVEAIRFVDYTHLCETTTGDVLRALRPRFYVKGADWRDRLPARELDICAEAGVEIVFVDTVRRSSSETLDRYIEAVRPRSAPDSSAPPAPGWSGRSCGA